jgi:hypothetical protein
LKIFARVYTPELRKRWKRDGREKGGREWEGGKGRRRRRRRGKE